jgi:hypothetical protein
MKLYRPKPSLFDGRTQLDLYGGLPLGDVLPACAAPPAQTALAAPAQGDCAAALAVLSDAHLADLATATAELFAAKPQMPGLLAYREKVQAEVDFRNDDPERTNAHADA